MKKIWSLLLLLSILNEIGIGQQIKSEKYSILFHGLVLDAATLTPLAGSKIIMRREIISVSGIDGTFAFYVNKNDTVIFSRLGYKATQLFISDTLTGKEFIAGVYLHADTISIGEVVIAPRVRNLKNELLNSRPETSTEMENAKYNVAVSSYIGRNSTGNLGNPGANYEVLRQKQRIAAYEKGSILPSENMIGINPLIVLPAAYLLIHGSPEKPDPLKPQLTDKEVNQINKMYLETLRKKE
jgi:hypothetical protein